jgi:hypothetical protein
MCKMKNVITRMKKQWIHWSSERGLASELHPHFVVVLIILKQGFETMCSKIKLNHEEKREWENENEKLH